MIIGISGKISSGKDTIGKIIQYLTSKDDRHKKLNSYAIGAWINNDNYRNSWITKEDWQIRKFADKLKDIVCLLIGCTREQLEDSEFKNKELGEEWIRYAYASGFTTDNNGKTTMLSTDCDKERYELELKTNWQTAYKVHYTPRLLLQRLGTEAGRDLIHPNIWVNATFANYKTHFQNYIEDRCTILDKEDENAYPNWVITDVRFHNEADAIKDRDGILIRVNRKPNNAVLLTLQEHPSETSLDNYQRFDYTIDNNGTIEQLVEKIKFILEVEKVI